MYLREARDEYQFEDAEMWWRLNFGLVGSCTPASHLLIVLPPSIVHPSGICKTWTTIKPKHNFIFSLLVPRHRTDSDSPIVLYEVISIRIAFAEYVRQSTPQLQVTGRTREGREGSRSW